MTEVSGDDDNDAAVRSWTFVVSRSTISRWPHRVLRQGRSRAALPEVTLHTHSGDRLGARVRSAEPRHLRSGDCPKGAAAGTHGP